MGRVSDARDRMIDATIDLIRRASYSSVTVDAICDVAKVKKGSFYHFFKSKDDLVVAALETHWEKRRPELDQLFSPVHAPLDRLRNYFASVFEKQTDLRKKYGHFVGCLYSSVGAGVSEASPEIRKHVQQILSNYQRYYESALRDAQARGQIRVDDIPGKAQSLFAFMEGVLSQARIHDDPQVVQNLGDNALRFLGLSEASAPTASTR
ncbi:MAG: TetR family transcriptional regulator [Myxococcales bacterium]|nr:TetR family transcriptional regulator [Myxococcales bacterium]